MDTLFENSASIKYKEFQNDIDLTLDVSKEYLEKGNELINYISSQLFNKNITKFTDLEEIKIESNQKEIIESLSSTIIKKSIFIYNEEFFLENDNNMIIISHPRWSLIGQGTTLYDAIKNMNELAFEVYISLADDKTSDLTLEAYNLREFLFKVF